MKIKNLRLDKSCSENWERMSSDSNGKFCQLCSKTVIDFTKLTNSEISEKVKASKGNICARLTKSQIIAPILDGEKSKDFSLPYSKVAAGVMLVASLNSIQSCKEYSETQKTELVTINPSGGSNQLQKETEKKAIKKKTTFFQGKIFSKDSLPLQKAKITFVTIGKLYSAFTDHHGVFKLEIPNDVIDDDNVIRLSFDDLVLSEGSQEKSFRHIEYYENDDLVLSRTDMEKEFVFYAESDSLYLGGIGLYEYELKNNPLVIVDGVEVPFEEFQKSRFGKKSTCNLENKEYYHFDSKSAKALCGDKAKYGLYLFYSKG